MCRCYRDTKMEIQGLSDAQNTRYQHGAPRKSTCSPLEAATGTISGPVSKETVNRDRSETHGPHSDNNNNQRPRSPSLRLLAENGSDPSPSFRQKRGELLSREVQASNAELCHLNVLKEKEYGDLLSPDFVRAELKYAEENEDSVLQMALPLFDSEDGYAEQPDPSERRHTDGNGNATPSESAGGNDTSGKNSEEFYVVFNIVQEDGAGHEGARRARACKGGEKSDAPESALGPEKVQRNLVKSSKGDLTIRDKYSAACSFHSILNDSEISGQTVSVSKGRRGACFEAEDGDVVALTIGECERNQTLSGAMMSGGDLASVDQNSGELSERECKTGTTLMPGGTDTPETGEMTDSEYITDYVSLASGSNGDEVPDAEAHETFSGTIMINNQSIIVTIENGVLTLAAPPEGWAYKEDGMASLKEHLGMKEHEDIVLLNYDGGTKSIGKISNVAVSTPEESASGAVASDSELTLADECPLSDLGQGLDSCSSVKQETGDSTPAGRSCKRQVPGPVLCEEDEPVNLAAPPAAAAAAGSGLAKKGALVTYNCPHSGCTLAFDSRQKLKMHLVFHTEEQRPFKCTVEGCGWSFTTSYKLKRHLQSHDKLRPYRCEWEKCGRSFTTVYNLKAHMKAHEQEDAFACEMCSERFRSATRLASHQRTHFEPERPHKCEFPGCEKAFITFSALFSHNRTHFRETGQFTCTYPGCDKRYDKACRLKIHLRSHTGERPFVCDSESCGWTFTSMSKLLRHKRKHDDDRRFTCLEEGCGKSFTRAEHLKGHSITHLGTKPFECPVEGCNAKFSARSSLYIHSKKHRQDGVSLRSGCPVAGCTKHFSSRSSLKSHMLKHHNLSPDVLSQLESTATLTPSCELTSAAQTATTPGSVGAELNNLDLSSLFSAVPSGTPAPSTGTTSGPGPFTMDLSLVSGGILTIDPATVSSSLGGAKSVDPLVLAAGADIGTHVLDAGLGSTGGGGVLPQATLHLDDVQTVNPEALGALTALAIQNTSAAEQLQALSSTCALTVESPNSSLTAALTPSLTSSLSSSITPSLTSSLVPTLASSAGLAGAPVPELLSPRPKTEIGGGEAAVGSLLSGVEVLVQPESNKGMSQFVFSSHSASFSVPKETELPSVAPFMESSGSARTDYRAIQLAKRRKQKGPAAGSGATLRKTKVGKGSSATGALAPTGGRFGEGTTSTAGGLTLRDPVTGAQYVQIQLLQDDPATDGDLAFQLSSQTSSSHSQLTVDLPVNILQEPSAMAEDDNGSDNSQFTGSTINLQDLE